MIKEFKYFIARRSLLRGLLLSLSLFLLSPQAGAMDGQPPSLSPSNYRLLTATDFMAAGATATVSSLAVPLVQYSVSPPGREGISRACARLVYRFCGGDTSSPDMKIRDLFKAPAPNPQSRRLLGALDARLVGAGWKKSPIISIEDEVEYLKGYLYTLSNKRAGAPIPTASVMVVRRAPQEQVGNSLTPQQLTVFYPLHQTLNTATVEISWIDRQISENLLMPLHYSFSRAQARVVRGGVSAILTAADIQTAITARDAFMGRLRALPSDPLSSSLENIFYSYLPEGSNNLFKVDARALVAHLQLDSGSAGRFEVSFIDRHPVAVPRTPRPLAALPPPPEPAPASVSGISTTGDGGGSAGAVAALPSAPPAPPVLSPAPAPTLPPASAGAAPSTTTPHVTPMVGTTHAEGGGGGGAVASSSTSVPSPAPGAALPTAPHPALAGVPSAVGSVGLAAASARVSASSPPVSGVLASTAGEPHTDGTGGPASAAAASLSAVAPPLPPPPATTTIPSATAIAMPPISSTAPPPSHLPPHTPDVATLAAALTTAVPVTAPPLATSSTSDGDGRTDSGGNGV